MSKIAIISQPDQGVLIDVGGCSSLKEALEHLSSTLQSSNQFWKGNKVILGLGSIELTVAQAAQVLALAKGVGVFPEEVYSKNEKTRTAFLENSVKVTSTLPMSLPKVNVDIPASGIPFAEADAESQKAAVQLDVTMIEMEHDTVEDTPLPEATAEVNKDGSTVVLPQVLYVKQTLRSGQVVSHKGDLVIVGDVNPGAEIMAEGDITVWGSLRGIAHAGIGGNTEAEIRALNLQPIQIRIAHAIARAPDRPRITYANGTGPEIARIVEGKIRIQKNKID
ncbi:MAG: septum site-determining protein MinC [Candidatus Obscuribacterales bacterium]|jgi:septum site-determining protein MinC